MAMAYDYIKMILTAHVYDVARETPLEFAPTLSRRLGNAVWLKREDEQPVFSFKCRDRKSTRLNSSHMSESRMPSSA